MKYALLALITVVLFSCKSSKELKSSKEEMVETFQNTWEKVNFKPEKGLVLPLEYSTYILHAESFKTQLIEGTVEIPNEDGSLSSYQVKDSGTMSPGLQEKFPNIRTYVGNNPDNTLCQARIDQKDMDFKITLLCNDATIYVQQLHDLGIYFIYNKSNLPNGVGTVKE